MSDSDQGKAEGLTRDFHEDPFVDLINNQLNNQCARIAQLEAENKVMEDAVRFYSQKPVPDITSEFAKSAEQWGEHVVTWEPLTDLGERGREALAKIEAMRGGEKV